MDKYSTYKWISKVIHSSTTVIQWGNCLKLVNRFKTMFEDYKLTDLLKNDMRIKLEEFE